MRTDTKIKSRKSHVIKIIIICLVVLSIIFTSIILSINNHVKAKGAVYIINNISENGKEEKYDCILVLGCGLNSDGTPGTILQERLKTALQLYNLGYSDRILVSGDHGTTQYNEVEAMKSFLINNGIKSDCIFMDHAGFSTYDTIYRAKSVFCAENIIIVTQKYHLYRSLFLAEKLGIKAIGVPANDIEYNYIFRESREIFARSKDFIFSILKPKPKYLGETIDIKGNGDLTNDY